MKSRASCFGTLLPAVLLLAACQDDPVHPADAAGDSDLAPVATMHAGVVGNDPAVDIYRVRLSPLNESGVHGTATLMVGSQDLVVGLQAVDHVPDQTHVQHIHGFADGTDATCPAPEVAGEDGVLTFGEGLPFYGPVQLNLAPAPTPANAAGSIQYRASFEAEDFDFDPSDLELKTFVLHGDFVEGEFVGSLPVACGVVERVN